MRRRHSILSLICILIVVSTACSHRKSVAITPNAGSATNVYQSGSPDDLSEYIRTVLKISQQNTVAAADALKQLHERKPDLGALSRLIVEYPDDVQARRLLASAYLEEGFYLNAFQLYQEIRMMVPEDPIAELAIARIWSEWGDYPMALRHAERASALDPKSAKGKELLGRIHLRRNETALAIRAFLDALKIEPDNPVLLANAGYGYYLNKDWDKARGYLARAVDRDGSLLEARNNLGIVLVHLGDRNGAIQQFRATSDLATALNNLGVVYLEQKRYTEARDAFKEALGINPDYLKARANLSEAVSHLQPPSVINLPSSRDEKNDPAEKSQSRKTSQIQVFGAEKSVFKSGESNEKMATQPVILPSPNGMSRISIAYQDALNRFNRRRFQEALEIFGWLLQRYPNHDLADNCEYWIGESYFALGKYDEALASFKRVLNYRDSTKRRDAQTMIKQASFRIEKEKARIKNKH